jgi:Rieske Fe-S protein
VPTAVTVRVARQDGYYEAVEQQVVYLTKSDGDAVRAMSSTCTHLGCRTSYDPTTKLIKCPCHGGVYTTDGKVVAGPPPRPLPRVAVRVDGAQVFVQI